MNALGSSTAANSQTDRLAAFSDDVDKTLAAKPLKLSMPANGPVPRLVEELARRPGLAHFELERGNSRLIVTRHAPARAAA